MERAIKFRAFDTVNKTMYFWSIFDEYTSGSIERPVAELRNWYATSKRLIVIQFTGLKDKNGKEIYEGDIVVIPNQYLWFDYSEESGKEIENGKALKGKGIIPNYRGTVEWIYSAWQVVAHCVNPGKRGISDGMNYNLNDDGVEDGKKCYWEIIGNIHENPELLKS